MWADGPMPSADTPTAMLAGLRPPRDPGGPRPPRRPLGPRRPVLIVIAAAAVGARSLGLAVRAPASVVTAV